MSRFLNVIQRGDYLILDTETTGLGGAAEICQIAIIDADGAQLMYSYVKPSGPIPTGATAIHGITDEMVASAPSWPDILPQIQQLLDGRDVIIYNAGYDIPLMEQSAAAHGLARTGWHSRARFWCAMLPFAEVYGDWNDYRQNYRWQKLTTAAAYYSIPEENAHDALGDCLMTLAVCKAMAGGAA